MTARQAGVALMVVHLAIVGTLGAKLLADRARLPRGWARTLPYDPDLPIRGRYVRLRLEIALEAAPDTASAWDTRRARLAIRDERVTGVLDEEGERVVRLEARPTGVQASLEEPVAYFIPEHIPDPSLRPAGEELWAEVTLPPRGPPRPIRLGVRKDGTLTPLEIR